MKATPRARFSLAFSALLVAGWASPTFASRMIQNTTVGTVTAGNLVPCNDPGGFTHWTNSNIPWYHNTAGQGAGKQTALQNAMASWTNVASTDHTLTYAGTTTTGWAADGVNTVLWAIGNGCTGSCLALTQLTLQAGQVIVESDITFNTSFTWNTNGLDYDTEAVAAHELGHSLGIHHTEVATTPRPTMYASYFGTDGRSLHADDIAALQCAQSTYPFSPPSGTPLAPALLDVQPSYCLGRARMVWSSSTGASYYELELSYTSTFSSPVLIYSGSGTSRTHNGGAGTKWYRARACNTSGCSGWRNGDETVGYYNPCL